METPDRNKDARLLLYELFTMHFSAEELDDLIFHLSRQEELKGVSAALRRDGRISTLARELISYMQRRDKLEDLLAIVQDERPELFGATEKKMSSREESKAEELYMKQSNSLDITKIVVAIIGAIAIILVGYWQFVWKPNQTQEVTNYVGRVVDTVSQEPVGAAKVSLEIEGITPLILYTDEEGVFRFAVPNADGRIRIEALGYQRYDRFITLSTTNTNIEDIRLTPSEIGVPSQTPTTNSESNLPFESFEDGKDDWTIERPVVCLVEQTGTATHGNNSVFVCNLQGSGWIYHSVDADWSRYEGLSVDIYNTDTDQEISLILATGNSTEEHESPRQIIPNTGLSTITFDFKDWATELNDVNYYKLVFHNGLPDEMKPWIDNIQLLDTN